MRRSFSARPMILALFMSGLAMLCPTISLVAQTWQATDLNSWLEINGASTEGRIIDQNTPRGAWPTFEVEFITQTGETVVSEVPSLFSPYRRGDQVTVRYNPDSHGQIMVVGNGPFTLWLAVIFSIASLGSISGAIVWALILRRSGPYKI
jgi:hypothetical protein